VKDVDAGSAAAKAGIHAGDLVTAINGKPTPNFMEAFRVLDGLPIGEDVVVDCSKAGREPKSVKIPLVEIPQLDGAGMMWTRFGIRVRELNDSDLSHLAIRQKIALFVTEVDKQGQAFKEGVAPGDLITRFGGRPVTTLDTLGHLLEHVNTGDRFSVGVWRIGDEAIIQVELPLAAK
jgi:S1-C subfamily serine protease